jgi:apolipoprotein N-acyltransferase
MRAFRGFAPDWLTLASGALITFMFPPWDLAPLGWIAAVPWLFAIRRARGPREALLQGVWLSVFMSLGIFNWVYFALREYIKLPWPVAVLGLLFFSLVNQPQYILSGWLLRLGERALEPAASRSSKRWALYSLSLALAYAGMDWLTPKLFVDTFGQAFYRARWLRQAADLAGPWSLTMLVFLANHAIFTVLRLARERRESGLRASLRVCAPSAVIALALPCAATVYGALRLREVRADLDAAPRHLIAAVIQANIGNFYKESAVLGVDGAVDKILGTFYEMSERALKLEPKPDVLVWPETSYPALFRKPRSPLEAAHDEALTSFVRTHGVPLVFGGYDRAEGKDFNTLFFLSPRSGDAEVEIYHKTLLLPFGEFIPLADDVQALHDAFPLIGHFGRGPGPQALTLAPGGGREFPVKAAPIICYESLFPYYSIEGARKGAELILNVTNDSWFGPTGERPLHLSLAVFRSIETRLPQLRAANTGISTLILPDGEITQVLPVDEPAILNARVPLSEPRWTLMKAWGDWFGPFALLAGPLGLAATWALGRRARARSRAN